MKPPMKQKITLYQTVLDGRGNVIKDEYGRPQKSPIESIARTQFSTRVVLGTDGQQHETSLEVDLPPELTVNYGDELEYVPRFGMKAKGLVIAMNESTNLSGNKVYFRTVYIGQG